MTHVANNSAAAGFVFDNTYARELEGFYVPWKAASVARPVWFSSIGPWPRNWGSTPRLSSEDGAQIFAGNVMPEGAAPLAQAYAGHQFGGFSPQLGDGRALLLGEVLDRSGHRRDIQLKGSGPTPFARSGDGRAALGPVLREYLLGEAMHALGIPTTRALAAVRTGEPVYREVALPGAVLTRVAASHIRVGTFQWCAARGEQDQVRRLADYVIARHYREVQEHANPYLGLLERVCDRQAALIARWMHVGFIHGVMNTDNMTISGETIDYGPCAFMDQYDPATVFSAIDTQGRYAYANQPHIAQWNLARLAETLLPLLDADSDRALTCAIDVIKAFPTTIPAIGCRACAPSSGWSRKTRPIWPSPPGFSAPWRASTWTTRWRSGTSPMRPVADQPLRALFAEASAYDHWCARWQARLAREAVAPAVRAQAMRRANPAFIARNHRVEEALSAAVDHNDYAPFATLCTSSRGRSTSSRRLPPLRNLRRQAKGAIAPSAAPETHVRP